MVRTPGYGFPARLHKPAQVNVQVNLGRPPTASAKGGPAVEIVYALADCPLGRLLLAATGRGLCFLAFGDEDAKLLAELQAEFPNATSLRQTDQALASLIAKILTVLEGGWIEAQNIALNVPLDVAGTAFQRRVWTALMEIPIGHVWSYSKLATHLGLERGQRAVAQGCARNRLCLLIPCHRVLRSDGTLGGYRWGLERKAQLLDAEARLIPDL